MGDGILVKLKNIGVMDVIIMNGKKRYNSSWDQ